MVHTLEQGANQERLADAGVALIPNTTLLAVETGQALLRDSLHRRDFALPADGVVMVTSRLPKDGLHSELQQALEVAPDTEIRSLRRIGDCAAPGIIATAVYEGHRYARELGTEVDPCDVPFRRERHVVESAKM
jgi:dimethylamine/trimethylamine dehydrogenase